MKSRSGLVFWLALAGGFVTVGRSARGVEEGDLLPVERLAQVTFRGADLGPTRQFYSGTMGFPLVSPREDEAGKPRRLFFKVNDEQFLAFSAPPDGEAVPFRLERIAFQTHDIRRARAWVEAHRLEPGPIARDDDGNLAFALADPDGVTVSVVEYQSGSWQTALRGKSLGPRRIADRLQHVGLTVASEPAAMAFYRDKLGFWEQNRGGPPANPGEIRWIIMMMPRSKADFRGDFIEFMVHAADPPERRQHLCFAVADIERAHQELVQRPDLGQQRFQPFSTPSGLKLMNVRDPNGLRIEFWEVK